MPPPAKLSNTSLSRSGTCPFSMSLIRTRDGSAFSSMLWTVHHVAEGGVSEPRVLLVELGDPVDVVGRQPQRHRVAFNDDGGVVLDLALVLEQRHQEQVPVAVAA